MSHTGSVGEKVVFCIRCPTVVKLKVKVCSVSYTVVHTDTLPHRISYGDTLLNIDTLP